VNEFEQAVNDYRALRLRVGELGARLGANARTPLGSRPGFDFEPVASPERKTAPNDLRNGDYGHSVNTWNEAAPSGGDKDKECAHWFSHDAPSAAQALDESTSLTDLNVDGDATPATNKTLKYSSHSTYSALYSDWERSKGLARLQGTKTLDAPYPSNQSIFPGRTKCIDLIAALANEFIVVPSGFRLWVGLYDNTAAKRDFLKAASAFRINSATVRNGTPSAPRELRYRIYAETDRGYTFLSDEFVQPNAPSDAEFNAGLDVYLSWQKIEGILTYMVYRYDPVAAVIRLLERIDNGATTYGDNNRYEPVAVAAYPTATDDRAKAYVATRTGELDSLAIDGVSAAWSSLFFNVPPPALADLSATTDKIWFRMGQNMALDRRVTDAVVNNGSPTLVSATAAFTSLDTGRTVTVTDALGNTKTATVTYVNATTVTMASNWTHANAVGCTLLVVGGGDHGLLVDLVHSSYIENASFSPSPEDDRLDKGGQQPVAAPNGSSQGGVGTGGSGEGSGEGGLRCVEVSEPVAVMVGGRLASLPFSRVCRGDAVVSGDLVPNVVREIKRAQCEELWSVRTENGVDLLCSPTHRLITGRSDRTGRAVRDLRAGEFVLTFVRDHVERSRLWECETAGFGGEVGTFSLGPGHVYVAGREARRGFWRRLLDRALMLAGLRARGPVGLLSHNLKIAE
jgi:hypothetical protein